MQRREVLARFDTFANNWEEVTGVLAVRSRANALLARHPLRAADAGQLGATAVGAGAIGWAPHVCLPGSAGVIGGRRKSFVFNDGLF